MTVVLMAVTIAVAVGLGVGGVVIETIFGGDSDKPYPPVQKPFQGWYEYNSDGNPPSLLERLIKWLPPT